jgi:hypothetical protein
MSFAGLRFATTTTCWPTSSSGSLRLTSDNSFAAVPFGSACTMPSSVSHESGL